ncbi:TonB-dependent receptor [Sphingobacterium sp. SRCM116780]|uniref:SusC/RagA family TonB-linked outer membrane protein n=1 Tax=Sphingobacterium sp. SRCM116780 TaxID=2907623 RepID=UPI001F257123|nr:TonB-dependent receptor [Sphingobacterium sp. SRCM116780]UIR57524.1 TonB-dependent receptor [Sphingobacterium sp. SRCM116780]
MILNLTKKKLGMLMLTALLSLFSTLVLRAQTTVNLSGRVTDQQNGLPLPGVSVKVKDGSSGVSTDKDGRFSLSAPPRTILVISSIGYLTKELPGAENMNVVLSSSYKDLQEVTVVGVSVRKSDLTGAVAGIDEKTIRELPATNINQAIQGRISGVLVQNTNPRPGSSGSIKVRGNNSIRFGASPIYVVDGLVIDDGAFNSVNPDDIASIDVLKDASATAIYGSRGANGVILVTTKKGKNPDGAISYNAWVGIQSFTKNVSYLNAQQIADLRIDAYANKYMDDNPTANRQSYINTLLGTSSPIFSQDELAVYRSGDSYNWLEEITQRGVQQNHTATFSKGGENGSAYVSFNYTDQKGLLKTSNYKRYGGQVNLEQKIKPWLKIGTNTNFSRTNESYIDGGVFNIAANANPLLPINADIPYLSWKGIQSTDLYNPIRSLDIDGKGNLNRLLTTNYLAVNPIPGLTVRSGISLDVRNQDYLNYIPKTLGQSIRNATSGSATQKKENWLNWQWDNSVSYDKAIGKHNFSGLASFGLTQNNYNYNQVDAFGFATDDFSYKYLGGAYLKDRTQLASDFVTNSLISYVARGNYNYGGKYFATLTARYDGSSKFGNGKKWGLFPSLALAWDISKEDFFKNVNLDMLKLRAGYGIAGNQNIPNFAYSSLYRPVFSNGSVSYISDGRLGNADLVWEKQKQLNIGIDVGLLKNRLTINADYFVIHNDDLLMERTLSTTTGFRNTIANVGSLLNKGAELNIMAKIIEKEDFQWSLGLNISSYKNKITKLYGSVDAIYNYGGFTGVEIQRTGNLFLNESLNSIYTYKFDKIAQAEDIDRIKNINFGGHTIKPGDIIPVDVNGDNKIDDQDRIVVGKTDPKFYGGFSSNLAYKGFSLNAVFNYNYGGKGINSLYDGLMNGTGEYAGHTDQLNRWTPQNTGTNIPRAYVGGSRYGVGETDYSVQSTSFLRMTALTLGYNFNQAILTKAKMTSFRLYMTGSNLFTITNYKGYDPEGGDSYPTSKMIVFGLNVGF